MQVKWLPMYRLSHSWTLYGSTVGAPYPRGIHTTFYYQSMKPQIVANSTCNIQGGGTKGTRQTTDKWNRGYQCCRYEEPIVFRIEKHVQCRELVDLCHFMQTQNSHRPQEPYHLLFLQRFLQFYLGFCNLHSFMYWSVLFLLITFFLTHLSENISSLKDRPVVVKVALKQLGLRV